MELKIWLAHFQIDDTDTDTIVFIYLLIFEDRHIYEYNCIYWFINLFDDMGVLEVFDPIWLIPQVLPAKPTQAHTVHNWGSFKHKIDHM